MASDKNQDQVIVHVPVVYLCSKSKLKQHVVNKLFSEKKCTIIENEMPKIFPDQQHFSQPIITNQTKKWTLLCR